MTNEERTLFWKTLSSFNGEQVDLESKVLREVLKYPHYLYRFRAVSNSTLDVLRTNRLYFSTADKYDDPFDTFLYIDWDNIINEMRNAFENDLHKQTAFTFIQKSLGFTQESISNFFTQHSTDEWINFGKHIMTITRDNLQKNQLSICFSEDALNETLWLKYAQNHTGFTLAYDLTDESAIICGKKDTCNACPSRDFKFPIYPIYYSDNQYDATEYTKFLAMQELIYKLPPNISNSIPNVFPNMTWQRERISLIKHKCHEYDKEWRMINPQLLNSTSKASRPFIVWRPSYIILGLRIGNTEKNLVLSLAKEAGINKIYQCVINHHNKLDLVLFN